MVTNRCSTPLGQTLSVIDVPDYPVRFLILDCPTESSLRYYLTEFKRLHVTDVVRCCQATYSTAELEDLGIQVLDLPFKDGGVPPEYIVHEWLERFEEREQSAKYDGAHDLDSRPTIAVHCVAGLGRAPVLVAIALIEMGMPALDAVEFIRRYRRGAFNKPQIAYLDRYKRTLKTKMTPSKSSLKLSLGKMLGFGRELTSH